MEFTLRNRRRSFAVSFALLALGATQVIAQEAAANTAQRYRVLVPALTATEGAKDGFGKDFAGDLRKLIEKMPRHQPVPEKEMKSEAKRLQIKENELNCVENRQFAIAMQAELVLCGSYKPAAGGFELFDLQFVVAKEGAAFEPKPITAAKPEEAAAQIHGQFEQWVGQLERTAYCFDYLAGQDWARALENCDAAIQIAPSGKAHYGRSLALYNMALTNGEVSDSARMRQAYDAVKKTIELNPVDQDGLRQAGVIAARVGDNQASREYFRQYLEMNPGDASVRLAIAAEQAKAGDYEGAVRVVEEGLKNDTVNVDLLTYAGLFAAQAAFKADSVARRPLFEQSLGYYQRLFNSKNGEVEPAVMQQMMQTLLFLERTDEAIAFGQRVTELKPQNGTLWAAYANALATAKRVDEAVAAIDKAIATNDTAAKNLRVAKGQVLIQAGKVNDAAAAFQQAVSANEMPSDSVASLIWRYGAVEVNEKDYETALAYFDAARKFAQGEVTGAMLNYWTGIVLLQQGVAAAQKAQTAAAGRAAKPLLQRALGLFEQSRPYTQTLTSNTLDQQISTTRQFIEYADQLIKRGA